MDNLNIIEEKGPLIHRPSEERMEKGIALNSQAFPEKGWAIIFAGGTGQRMSTKTKPKQFLELHGKPIIIYTLEHFEQHELIDGIIIVCVKKWIDYCNTLLSKYQITKVKAIVPGGETGMLSRFR